MPVYLPGSGGGGGGGGGRGAFFLSYPEKQLWILLKRFLLLNVGEIWIANRVSQRDPLNSDEVLWIPELYVKHSDSCHSFELKNL